MKVSLLIVVALATVALCSAADPECVYRRIRSLSVHWADPSDCGRFYRCAKGSKREVICPDKKVYNQETGKCVTRRRGICKLSLAAPLVGEDNICADQVSGAYVAQSGSCRNFYICNNNEAYPQACDLGSYFNQTTANCAPDTEKTCWQNKCIDQPDGSYMPDASCLSFLICQQSDAVKQYCDSGSYYNTSDSNCQPDPDSTHCFENLCAVQPDGTYVKDITDCHGFYVCKSSNAIKQQCPAGSYFDWTNLNCQPGNCPSGETSTESCTDEPTTECSDDTPTPPSPTECSEDTTDAPSTECSEDKPTPPSSTECNEETTASPPQITWTCPGGYEDGEFLPYPDNCMLFYICADGALVKHSCEIGNYFDPIVRVCLPDTSGKCPQCSPTYRAKRSVDETELTDSEEFSCFGIYREGQLVKDPNDCRTFQLCYEGQMMLQDCGAGNYFDEYDNVCKVDAQGECGENGLMNNVQAAAVQATGADMANCTCPGGYAQGTMLPHPTICDQYYVCDDSKLQLQTCGVGERFDSVASACVLDTDNSCWPANVCKDQPDNTLVPDPANCAAFFMCKNGIGTPGDCAEGQWFNNQSAACEPDHGGHCINPCANTTGILFLPHPDCSKFYFCNNGTSHLETCTVGGFDVTMGFCHINATCEATMCKGLEDGTTFEVVGDPDKFYLCMNGIADIYDCLPNTAYNPKVEVCLSHPSTNCDQEVCKNGTDINAFPPIKQNSENTNFCYCREEGAYINQCQHGYTFNVNLGICYSNAPCDPELCYDQPEYWVSVNRNSTNSFCLCVMKDQIIVDCPGNATFNPRTLLCQPAAEQDPNCNPTYCLQQPDFTIFPPLTGNQGFCMCLGMGSQYMPCGVGTLFNETIGICMPNENAGSCDVDNCKLGNTFFPVPKDPASFCYCVSDTKVIMEKCPAGQAFSPEWLVCLEQAAPCNVEFCKSSANVILPAFNDPHSFCYCVNATTVVTESCPVGTMFNPIRLICLEDPCDTQFCKIAANDGRPFPADNYTQGFCLCQNGLATLIPCEPGSIFDTTHEICLPVGDVQCDIKLCVNASNENAYAIPAIDDPTSFCYCLAPNLVKKFGCPPNNIFDYEDGICINASPTPNLSPYQNTNVDASLTNCSCPGGYQEGQFLPNPASCQKYYICSAGKLLDSDCGTSNYFNADTGKCQSDTLGVCMPTDGCTCVGAYREGEVLAHPTRSQLFYMCFNSQLHEGDCGIGNVFDDQLKACVVTASGRTVPIKMRSKVSDKAVAAVDGEAEAQVENSHCLNNEKRSVPSNCSQYETCTNGKWSRRTCTQWRYYNPEQRKCLEPRDDTVCAYAHVTGLPVCNNLTMVHQITLPSKTSNCAQYFLCKESKWRLKACPKQHYYAHELHTCLSSMREDICTVIDANTNKTKTEQTNGEPAEPKSQCKHTEVKYYASNCAMFLMCLEGEWWYQYCPFGMYFNRTHNYCVPNDVAQCADATLAKPHNAFFEINEMSVLNCSTNGMLRPSALACDKYYVCSAGKWHQQNCATKQYFNVTEESCMPDTDNICAQISATCIDGKKRAFPLNCTAYELCRQGEWHRTNCQVAWAFDDVLEQCVPNSGTCAGNGLRRACQIGDTRHFPIVENCTQFYYCENDSWHIGACLKGYTYSARLAYCVPHTSNNKCKPTLHLEPLDVDEHIIDPEDSAAGFNSSCSGRDDGFAVPHPSDCNRFYLCVSEVPTNAQKCAAGSFFDVELRYCRPNDGTCYIPLTGACLNATDNTFVANPADCRSYYYCSTINGSQLLFCAEGEYYHNYTRQCRVDHGECQKSSVKGKCYGNEHGARMPHETYCNIYYACVRGLAFPVECPDEHQFSDALGRCVRDEAQQCEDGHLVNGNGTSYSCGNITDGVYLPDRTDCTRYYICSAGVALPKHCAAGTFFDSEQLLCIPDDGSCPFVDDDQPNLQPVPPDPIVCEGKHGNMMPDPANCNEFYVCINGKLRHERCYEHHFFNSTIYQCDPYENTNTEIDPTPEPPSENQLKSATKLIQCVDAPTNYTDMCVKMPEGTSVSEQGDCRRYISCQDDEATSQRCRNGESYDSLLGFCRQNDGTCLLENGQRVGECNGRHGQMARDTDNCRGYYLCINGQKIAKECAEDEFFSKSENMCQKDVLNQCNTATPGKPEEPAVVSCVGLSESLLYPYTHDNCRSYFQCVKGVPKIHECADGLYFNATITRCVKEVSQCVLTITTTPNLLRAPDDIPTSKRQLCENTTFGHTYANVEDHCHSYYICQTDGAVAYTTCPIGTLYNTESGECHEAKNVICRI